MRNVPPPPWRLRGPFVAALCRENADVASSFLPAWLRPLGFSGVAVGSYRRGSTLEYNELIVFIAARKGPIPCAYITHIYVDHPVSMRGGREIWGLPKEMARFDWDPYGVVVRQDDEILVDVRFFPARWGVPVPVVLPALGDHLFLSLGWMLAAPRAVRLTVGPTAPFKRLSLSRIWFSIAGPSMALSVGK